MRADELPSSLFELHRGVDAGLQIWGSRAVTEASADDIKWCRESFPKWEQSIVLPFICPPASFYLKRNPDLRDGYVQDFRTLAAFNYNIETEPLRSQNLVVFAYGTGGEHFVINAQASGKFEVKFIYSSDVTLHTVNADSIYPLDWNLKTFYQELHRQPRWYLRDAPIEERMKES